jgi:N,N'-diacetylchitobiose transport system substrate-binding protein
MRLRVVAVAVVGLALVLSAAAASGGKAAPRSSKATTVKVWLMVDAQQNWESVVNAANAAFERKHSGVDVKVEYQTWNTILEKFDAGLAGRNAPDVIELGNSQMVKYMANGAFANLTAQRKTFPNYKTWLAGLTDSVTYRGKLYGVPYYAGTRGVIYRKDLYKAAGIKGTPKSLDAFVAANRKLMKKYGKDQRFSALYFPGQYWLAAMSFVYDYGGAIARFKGGRWVGTLDSPQALKALTRVKAIVRAFSRASKTGDEANPAQALVFAKGKVGSLIANSWEWGLALNKDTGDPSLASKIGAYPMPSHIKGKLMPTFLGGSDLGVPITSSNKALAIDWLRTYTSTASMRGMATIGKVIPNTTSLVGVHARNPQLAPFAVAATRSWFVPNAPNWTNVESSRVIRNMLVKIVSNQGSVASNARATSRQITSILNAKT